MPAGDSITTVDGTQLEWRGLLLGEGTRYRLGELEGWLDLAETRDGDVVFDDEDGAQPGQLLAGRRVITWTGHIAGSSGFAEAVDALRRATTLAGQDELELVVKTNGVKAMARGRVIHRKIPQPLDWAVGYTQFVIQWRATNPRILRLPQLTPQTTPPVSGGGGLRFPLRFPLMFGGTPAGGELVLANDGHTAAQPVWRITGPCLGPRITNADTGERLWFDDDYQLPSGQQLDLSTEDKSVLLVASGVSRSNRLATREWFTLPPGASTRVRFDSQDGTGTLTCRYHHTDM